MLGKNEIGPLYQRDYWTVIKNCGYTPHELIFKLKESFNEFAPEETVVFYPDNGHQYLKTGDVLKVHIKMTGEFRVKVVHTSSNSITLQTMTGHPEAGRITFGAYRNDYGDVIFHIRSRARSSKRHFYIGFLAIGEAMQTNTWSDFVARVAFTFGDGVLNVIHVETTKFKKDKTFEEGPTYLAVGN